MDINSTVVDATPEEVKLTYPYLGSYDTGANKTISLFTAVNSGIILSSEAFPGLVGSYYTDLPENKYSLYHGSITLNM